MKRIITILLLVLPLATFAQISDADAARLKDIADKTAGIKTLFCNFRQVQEVPLLENAVVSTGKMQYLSSGKLVWKYETPKLYQLSVLEDKIVTTSDAGVKTTMLSDNPLMAQMRELIFGLMSGNQLRETAGRFDCRISEKGGMTVVRMIPKPRQLKKLFSSMEFTFSETDSTISKVVLSDADGGRTMVTFTDKKIER